MNDAYQSLVLLLRSGAKTDSPTIARVLTEAGKTHENLVEAVHVANHHGPAPGDPCGRAGCSGRLVVESSRRSGRFQIRYLTCPICGTKHGKTLAPASTIRRRQKIVT